MKQPNLRPTTLIAPQQLETLAGRIAARLTTDGQDEIQPGVILHRRSKTGEPIHGVVEPSLCIIAQGGKNVTLAGETFHYDPAHYLITTMQLPMVGMVMNASEQNPYLGLQLVLDPQTVTSVIAEAVGVSSPGNGYLKALDVSPIDANLLNAATRLVQLTEAPDDFAVLAPLIKREIIYWLLKGAQSGRLRHLARSGGQSHRMATAVAYLKRNFSKAIRIKDLAEELGMSTSTFHAHFKAATAMSPIQFQKQLRLQEARRLMHSEQMNAAEAGFHVGYEDASHFNREYKREFGRPPKQDIEQLLLRSV